MRQFLWNPRIRYSEFPGCEDILRDGRSMTKPPIMEKKRTFYKDSVTPLGSYEVHSVEIKLDFTTVVGRMQFIHWGHRGACERVRIHPRDCVPSMPLVFIL